MCFVCEIPASQCRYWGPPYKHCTATFKTLEWQRARDRAHHGLPPQIVSALPKEEKHGTGRTLLPKSESTDFAAWSPEVRAERYHMATKNLGERRLAALEKTLREKLFNRVAAGPFQLRRNFKYFDKDGNGTIDLDEFIECLEGLMGIVLPHEHVIALFARYDDDLSGCMDYQEFIAKLMGESKVRRFSKDESGLGPRRRADSVAKSSRSVDIISHMPPSSSRVKYAPKWDRESIDRNFPYNPLHGSEEGSLESCRPQLIPKKTRKKKPTFRTKLFRAQFANPTPADAVRRFEVTLYLDDNTVAIYEPSRRNTGLVGGKFLHRTKSPTRDEAHGGILTEASFFDGASFKVAGQMFLITEEVKTSSASRDDTAALPIRSSTRSLMKISLGGGVSRSNEFASMRPSTTANILRNRSLRSSNDSQVIGISPIKVANKNEHPLVMEGKSNSKIPVKSLPQLDLSRL